MGLDFIKNILQNRNRNYVVFSQLLNTIIALIYGKLVAVYVAPEDFGTFSIQMATYTFFFTLLIDPIILFIKTASNTLLPKIGSQPFLQTTIIMVVTAFIFTHFVPQFLFGCLQYFTIYNFHGIVPIFNIEYHFVELFKY